MTEPSGLVGNWTRFPHLAQELMDDPERFLSQRDVQDQDITCPEGVHEALEKARRLGEAMVAACRESAAAQASRVETVRRLRATVAAEFGEDFIAETVPFGILFRERVSPATTAAPAFTGTGTCTFCRDSDGPDID